MSIRDPVLAAIFSTEPLKKQRPFVPALILALGGLIMNGSAFTPHHRNWVLTYVGLGIEVIGLALIVRYAILRTVRGRFRHSSTMKAL